MLFKALRLIKIVVTIYDQVKVVFVQEPFSRVRWAEGPKGHT